MVFVSLKVWAEDSWEHIWSELLSILYLFITVIWADHDCMYQESRLYVSRITTYVSRITTVCTKNHDCMYQESRLYVPRITTVCTKNHDFMYQESRLYVSRITTVCTKNGKKFFTQKLRKVSWIISFVPFWHIHQALFLNLLPDTMAFILLCSRSTGVFWTVPNI